MEKKKLSKEEINYIGPNCAYIATQPYSQTGTTWKEIHLNNTVNRIGILQKKQMPITLENLYNLGDDYVSQFPKIRVYDPIIELLQEKSRKKATKTQNK
jgi:hypothetical protein